MRNQIFSMNLSMQKLSRKKYFPLPKRVVRRVETDIANYMACFERRHENGVIWLSEKNDQRGLSDILQQFSTLSEYEWNRFEYYNDKIYFQQYWPVIQAILHVIDRKMDEIFPDEAYTMIVYASYGKYAHVSVRICLDREDQDDIIGNLNAYSQPVMKMIRSKMQD